MIEARGTTEVGPVSIPKPVRDRGDHPVRPRASFLLCSRIGLDVLRTSGFVLALMELAYPLVVGGVVSRRYDLDLGVVLPVLWPVALSMLNDSMPVALLMGSSLVYGRLGADRELGALSSFGLSPWQIAFPAMVLGAVLLCVGLIVNGMLVPEMNYRKRDIRRLVVSQLQDLGEGRDRRFDLANLTLWIGHYSGTLLEDVLIESRIGLMFEGVPGSSPEGEGIETYVLFAEQGEILHDANPDDGRGAVHRAPFEIRLTNVQVYFSDRAISRSGRQPFMHRVEVEELGLPFDPTLGGIEPRAAKQLVLSSLLEKMRSVSAVVSDASVSPEVREYAESELADLSSELHGRMAKSFVLAVFPVFSAAVTLFLRSENRYAPFFVACSIGPLVFYGTGIVGEMLGRSGVPAYAVSYVGCLILIAAAALVLRALGAARRRRFAS